MQTTLYIDFIYIFGQCGVPCHVYVLLLLLRKKMLLQRNRKNRYKYLGQVSIRSVEIQLQTLNKVLLQVQVFKNRKGMCTGAGLMCWVYLM